MQEDLQPAVPPTDESPAVVAPTDYLATEEPVDDGTHPFIGRFGLRAGWGIALFFLIFSILSFALVVATRAAEGKSIMPKSSKSASSQSKPPVQAGDVGARNAVLEDGSNFIAVALAAWILSRIERRRFRVYGIGRNRLRDFLPGAFWGLALLSMLVGTLRATHVLVFDGRALTGPAIFVFGAKWLVAFLCVGLFEESLTRGYLQYSLSRGLYGLGRRISPNHARAVSFWIAAIFMSCLFGAVHLLNPGESAPGIAAVFLAGMVFSYALWHTGSLWWAIGFHMAWDWAQSFLYGVPDSGFLSAGRLFNTHPTGNPLLSGGTAGPEGSVFVLPTLVLVMVIVRFTTPAGAQPELEPLPKSHKLPPEPNAIIA